MRNGNHINTGDILHLAQIAVLLMSLGVFYEKIDLAIQQGNSDSAKIERIERYLSTRDANYWKLSRENQ